MDEDDENEDAVSSGGGGEERKDSPGPSRSNSSLSVTSSASGACGHRWTDWMGPLTFSFSRVCLFLPTAMTYYVD